MINQKKCEFEQAILKSVKAGFTSEETKRHAAACADCRETLKIASWLNNMSAASAAPPKNLPAAGFLWWKSRILEKRRAAEKVSRPLQIAQIIAAFAAFGTFFWLLTSGSPQFDFLLAAAFNRTLASMEIIAVPFVAGIICFSVACAALTFALRRLMPEK